MTLSPKEQRLENELRDIRLIELSHYVADHEERLPETLVVSFKQLVATFIRERRDEQRRLAQLN